MLAQECSAQDLCYFILSDYQYKQDYNFNYTQASLLQSEDKNKRFEIIKELAQTICESIIPTDMKQVMQCHIDPILFNQAVSKFSRDVYGQKRLMARLKNIEDGAEKREIEKYMDYGFKVNSANPYVHHVAAVFLYWFSVLKPFSISVLHQPTSPNVKTRLLCLCFNELITYFLLQFAMAASGILLTLEENILYFEDFLTDLHFRNLSRSSLEFFLASYQQNLNS